MTSKLRNSFILHGFLTILFLNSSTCVGQNTLTNATGTSIFLRNIFTQYGNKNATLIYPKKFKYLLQLLSLGSVTLERTDGFCAYKGVHTGMKKQQPKIDALADDKGAANLQNDIHNRQRRSGDHGHEKKVKENPKHSSHIHRHYQQCLTRESIFRQHNLNENDSVTKDDFLLLCPALIHQIAGSYCVHRHNCSQPADFYTSTVNKKMVWVYGFVAITVVSLASLCIIAVIPCLEKSFYQRLMGYLVALAVGTLAGDALLHLIPHSFENQTHGTSEEDHKKTIWKACFVLLGMYSFFVVEQLMKAREFFTKRRQQQPKQLSIQSLDKAQTTREDQVMHFSKSSNDDCECHLDEEKKLEETSSADGILPSNGDLSPVDSEKELIIYPPGADQLNHYDHDPHNHLENHDHHKKSHDKEHNHGHSHAIIDNKTTIASVAWMVIVGDGFHNFSDGLAIGAAFAASYTSGISTAIAVFCHELPHELGDFAVLIKSGMSIKQAVCYNLVSAALSYVGLVIGIIVGNYSDDGKQYALAITAGLFLYVALASMLPELTSSIEGDAGDAWSFISPHLGMLSGITIMLLISVYEDKF